MQPKILTQRSIFQCAFLMVLVLILGCSKKDQKRVAVLPALDKLPELPQNYLYRTNVPSGTEPQEKDTSFQESPNQGLEKISEEDAKQLVSRVD